MNRKRFGDYTGNKSKSEDKIPLKSVIIHIHALCWYLWKGQWALMHLTIYSDWYVAEAVQRQLLHPGAWESETTTRESAGLSLGVSTNHKWSGTLRWYAGAGYLGGEDSALASKGGRRDGVKRTAEDGKAKIFARQGRRVIWPDLTLEHLGLT